VRFSKSAYGAAALVIARPRQQTSFSQGPQWPAPAYDPNTIHCPFEFSKVDVSRAFEHGPRWAGVLLYYSSCMTRRRTFEIYSATKYRLALSEFPAGVTKNEQSGRHFCGHHREYAKCGSASSRDMMRLLEDSMLCHHIGTGYFCTTGNSGAIDRR
jgi:hypothetical protein